MRTRPSSTSSDSRSAPSDDLNISPTTGHRLPDQETTIEDTTYTLPHRLRVRGARLDHIEIYTNHGHVGSTDSEDIDYFLAHVGAAPPNQRNGSEAESYSKIFKTTPFEGGSNHKIEVRKDSITYGDQEIKRPLFSGKMHVKKRTNGIVHHCFLSSYLHLNPSRALNHSPQADSIFTTDQSEQIQRGLDGNDNTRNREIDLDSLDSLEQQYIERVYQEIDSELVNAARFNPLDIPLQNSLGSQSFSIRRVETYWEISATNAPRTLHDLKQAIQSYHRQYRVTDHENQLEHAFIDEVECNCVTMALFLSRGEVIKIYAKTHNCIRFEVQHFPHKQSNLLEGGYRADTTEILRSKIAQLKQRATITINSLLEHLREYANQTPQEVASSSQYAALWFQKLGFSQEAIDLLDLLRINGRVVRAKCVTRREANLIRKAKRKGLIRCSHGFVYPAPINNG